MWNKDSFFSENSNLNMDWWLHFSSASHINLFTRKAWIFTEFIPLKRSVQLSFHRVNLGQSEKITVGFGLRCYWFRLLWQLTPAPIEKGRESKKISKSYSPVLPVDERGIQVRERTVQSDWHWLSYTRANEKSFIIRNRNIKKVYKGSV